MRLYIVIILNSLQGLFVRDLVMNDENWKEQFKEWKTNLKPFQIKLLEEGAQSQSQALTLNDMWCEWKNLAVKKILKNPHLKYGDIPVKCHPAFFDLLIYKSGWFQNVDSAALAST